MRCPSRSLLLAFLNPGTDGRGLAPDPSPDPGLDLSLQLRTPLQEVASDPELDPGPDRAPVLDPELPTRYRILKLFLCTITDHRNKNT